MSIFLWCDRISSGPWFWHPKVSLNCVWAEFFFENIDLGNHANYKFVFTIKIILFHNIF